MIDRHGSNKNANETLQRFIFPFPSNDEELKGFISPLLSVEPQQLLDLLRLTKSCRDLSLFSIK
jgi:hypothetical protein